MNYDKGSDWRRWELHIHTPGTQKNDNFCGASYDEKWNKYYEDIHTYIGTGEDPLKNIAVIAITDYLSIDNYKKVVADKRLPDSVKLVLPNVEMRIQPIANDSPINIHFLFIVFFILYLKKNPIHRTFILFYCFRYSLRI